MHIINTIILSPALLIISGAIFFRSCDPKRVYILSACVLKLIALPWTGLIIFKFCSLASGDYLSGIILLAPPTATVTFVMAKEMRGILILPMRPSPFAPYFQQVLSFSGRLLSLICHSHTGHGSGKKKDSENVTKFIHKEKKMANGRSFWVLILLAFCFSACSGSGYNRYADDFYNQGIAWYQKGEYDRAIVDFTKVVEMAPEGMDNYVVYYNRGLAYYKLRDYDRAILDFDTALQLVAGRTPMGKYIPQIYDSSMEVPVRTPKLEYGVFNLYKARGDAWFYKKGYAEAIRDYDNALKYGEQRKELPTVYNSLAWCKFQTGAYKEAINNFSIALDMNPRSARDFYGRARAWAEIGDMNMALRDALVAHDLNPNSGKYDDLVFELKQDMKR